MTRSTSFETALEEIFEERASEFSPASRELLEKLFQQGVLEGRQLERQDQRKLGLEKAVRSECGNYLCIPVPREMLVLEGAEAGAARLEHEIRSRQRPLDRGRNPFSEMLAAMDGEILEKLASQAKALERHQPSSLVLALPPAGPRVPARQPANSNNWETLTRTSAAQAIGLSEIWKQEFFGSWSSSQSSSTADALRRCVTVTPADGSSDKP